MPTSALVYTSIRGNEEKVIEGTVSPEELRLVARVLRDTSFCSFRSSDRHGIPDEARPSVAIRYEDLDCRVQMWDGEFRDDENAKRGLAAVEDIGRAIEARAH